MIVCFFANAAYKYNYLRLVYAHMPSSSSIRSTGPPCLAGGMAQKLPFSDSVPPRWAKMPPPVRLSDRWTSSTTRGK